MYELRAKGLLFSSREGVGILLLLIPREASNGAGNMCSCSLGKAYLLFTMLCAMWLYLRTCAYCQNVRRADSRSTSRGEGDTVHVQQDGMDGKANLRKTRGDGKCISLPCTVVYCRIRRFSCVRSKSEAILPPPSSSLVSALRS